MNKENKKERIKEYSEFIQDVKTKYNLIITPDTINTVLHIGGINDEFIIPFIPPIEKSKVILNSLIENGWIKDDASHIVKLKDFYEKVKESSQKKNKLTNTQIIEEVKTKYNLIVNPSMISYVRNKLGICVKAKDNRNDLTQKSSSCIWPFLRFCSII